MTDQVHRPRSHRSLRRLLSLGLVAALSVALSACASSSPSSSDGASGASGAAGDLGQLNYAFSWLNDVTQAGPYIADTNGYYQQAGFSSVDFITGGPSAVSVLTQLANGTAQFGVSSPTEIVEANANGASFRVIGAMYQKDPRAIVSLAGKPINTPADLKGKTIAVADSDKPFMSAFLQVNGLQDSDVTIVPFQYDPAPLVAGQVDGILDYTTNSPISLKEAGQDPVVMAFSDYNWATVTQTYVASTDQIANDRPLLKAALLADIQGWRADIADPQTGADLTVNTYGKSLDLSPANQLAANQAEIALMKTPDTEANGILTVTDALQQDTVKTLALSGVNTSVGDLFDMSILNEIYQEHPELKTLP